MHVFFHKTRPNLFRSLQRACSTAMLRVHALNCDGCVLTASPCVSASLLPSHRAMVGLSRDCVSLVLSLLGVAGALPLVLTTRAIASPQDLRSVRAAYIAAARTFGMPWQIRALVRAAGASSFLPVAYLRLCYAVFLVVRLCFRPLRAPGVCLAYPLFGEVAPGCLQLAGPRSRESAFALVFAALGFLPPSHEDRHNLDGDLLLGGLPADPRVAWLRLNRGPWQASLRRIVALLRLGNSTLHFYHRAPELDRPPAFVLTFSVLGVSGCFVALEPDGDIATFLLPWWTLTSNGTGAFCRSCAPTHAHTCDSFRCVVTMSTRQLRMPGQRALAADWLILDSIVPTCHAAIRAWSAVRSTLTGAFLATKLVHGSFPGK